MELSKKIQSVEASAIREILKQTSSKDVISFAGGNPAKEAFPMEKIQLLSEKVLKEDPIGCMQYGITEGDPEFIKEVSQYFNQDEIVTKENDLMLTCTGSQQIMDLLAKVMCNENDVIACEEPAFLGALNSFKVNGAQLKGVGFIHGELDLNRLEEVFKLKPKFFYTIPNFQNPMGTTMSLETRKKVLALAYQYDVLILEDNPYGALRFKGEAIPSIKSLDTKDQVIYAASLSKIFAPGLRLALCIGNKEIVGKMVIAKQGADVHTNLWAQKVVARFFKEYSINEHVESIRKIYKHKCELMLQEMDKHFHPSIKYTRPDGGMFIWAKLPEGKDVQAFVQAAIKQNVAIVPGQAFYVDQIDGQSFRLNFSTPTDKQIVDGIEILGKLTYQL